MSSVCMTFVGKERFLKKDKSGYWHKVHFNCTFSDEKEEAGCFGFETGNEFVSEECWHSIKPEDVGREFVFEYGMNQYRKPEVIGMKFAETKAK